LCRKNLTLMKKILPLLIAIVLAYACGSNHEQTMLVNGNIKGLKKGTLFFQKVQDSVLINLDSIQIKGDGNFEFEIDIESPEIFYLYLDKKDNNDINDRITFFGEPGIITVTTTWNTFDVAAKIEGSETHAKYEAFKEVMSKFNQRGLAIFQALNNPEIANDSIAIDSLVQLSDKNDLRSYLYALNYALNNGDSYLAPYVILSEVANANPKYLDSVNSVLSPEVANSAYGRALQQLVDKSDTANSK